MIVHVAKPRTQQEPNLSKLCHIELTNFKAFGNKAELKLRPMKSTKWHAWDVLFFLKIAPPKEFVQLRNHATKVGRGFLGLRSAPISIHLIAPNKEYLRLWVFPRSKKAHLLRK